jgi:hypothetical protein
VSLREDFLDQVPVGSEHSGVVTTKSGVEELNHLEQISWNKHSLGKLSDSDVTNKKFKKMLNLFVSRFWYRFLCLTVLGRIFWQKNLWVTSTLSRLKKFHS